MKKLCPEALNTASVKYKKLHFLFGVYKCF